MELNHTLLRLSSLSLHTGFGFVLGLLWKRWRQNAEQPRGIVPFFAFLCLVYLPSCLVILGLDERNGAFSIFTLMLGFVATFVPLFKGKRITSLLNSPLPRKIYPAASMLLLASWSMIVFVQDGIASGVPLALTSTIAGIAALQYKPKPS